VEFKRSARDDNMAVFSFQPYFRYGSL